MGSGSPGEEDQSCWNTQQEMASFVSVSTTFHPGFSDTSNPDVILLSEDSVWFYVDSEKLHRASDNSFGYLLPRRSPGNGKPDFNYGPIISVPECSGVVNILLHAVYALSPANHSPSFADLSRAARLVPAYGMAVPTVLADSPASPLYALIAAHAADHPFAVYTLAAQLDLHVLASHASQYLHSHILSGISDEEATDIGPIYLKRLFFLHYGRVEALKRILLDPPRQHAPTKSCDYVKQRGLARAWVLASAYLVWDSPVDLSTLTINSSLAPLVNSLACKKCQDMLEERTEKLVTEWGAIKVTI